MRSNVRLVYIYSPRFYPVCPGSDEYIFGLPQIQQAEISLKAGKKLKIQVCNQSEENKYIQAIYWNGERYTKRFISHHTLIEGGNLIYEMGNKLPKLVLTSIHCPIH